VKVVYPPSDEAYLYDLELAPITEFAGPWSFLSNFHRAVLDWEGQRYPTSEHAFNAGKSLDPKVRAWIAAAPKPREAKTRGNNRNRCLLRPDWDTRVRYQVMTEVLLAKFTAHPARRDALLSTGRRLLIEGNRWDDQHWGTCLCGRPACLPDGLNHLGRTLMRIRFRLAG